MLELIEKPRKMGVCKAISANIRMSLLVLFCCWNLMLICADGQRTSQTEVDALRTIKNSLIDPFGNLAGWRRGDPCNSSWTGIVCYNTTLDDGQLHVRDFVLYNMNITGTLSPAIGRLSYLKILDIMWNNITGSIPKEIGNLSLLELLLLNGNQLTGSLPDELGLLSNLDRIQIDQNHISGPIPQSFANLTKIKHFHMNNCSLSGQIPPGLSRLPVLVHLLLDNNNLSGFLPPELSETPILQIIQLDNNNFEGTTIPSSYGNMPHLLKLSLRNCSLQGSIPSWSNMTSIAYIDLSLNHLTGSIPTGSLSPNITTIDLSNNRLNGTIPATFSSLPRLQKLSLANNSLNGPVASTIWQNRILNETEKLILDFENNLFSNISGSLSIPQNVTIGLRGNPVCLTANLGLLCGPHDEDFSPSSNTTIIQDCPSGACPPFYEYAPPSPTIPCFCAAPLYVGYRLKSPGFSNFPPYIDAFKDYISSNLRVDDYQLEINSAEWQTGPRLRMYLKIFPKFENGTNSNMFNMSEVFWIREQFSSWKIRENQVFGPYELLNFTLAGVYKDELNSNSSSGISKGALAGIIIGTIVGSVALTAFVSVMLMRRRIKKQQKYLKRRTKKRISMKIDGVKDFTYREMSVATNDFDSSYVVGQGGYGKVYKGVLDDGKVVAIKRALEGSLQGEKEFLTEIELLSRLHHRNLVSLVGYCDEESEQMLVYEFMSNGTVRDHLSGNSKLPLSFAMRVKTLLGAARGINYLHTEANPPIFHRDIKASNILLDSRFNSKVADFGLSRLAPVPELEGAVPSHVSTVVKGTPGYLDPEYFLTHKLTDKSDVYSLGVVCMELLTGMHPISHGKNIVREVNTAYRSGMIFSVIDEQMGSYPSECIEKFINLAIKCCKEATDERPHMTEVVRELESIWLMLPESDTKITELSSLNGHEKNYTSSSSSSTTKNPFLSQDVSGSDLISGVVHTVVPR